MRTSSDALNVVSGDTHQFKANAAARVGSGATNWSVVWAWVGVLWLLLVAYSMTMWIVSGQAKPIVPVGAEHWRVIMFHWIEGAGYLAAILTLAYFVVLPKIQTGHIPTTGLVILAFGTLWYQDPLLNYVVPYGLFSSLFTNWGSWSSFFPGEVAPNINLVPEPPFQECLYLTGLPGIVFAVLWSMRKWKARYPSSGALTLFAVGIVFGAFWDLVLELPAVFAGLWAYPGSLQGLTWWPGKGYQFPWYEAPMLGVTFATWAAVLLFRNDRDQMICERGLERLRGSESRRTLIRYLAIVGLFQTVFFTTYNIPTWMVTLHSSAWPTDFPKYLLNGVCGSGTEVMCPGPGVPYARGKEGLVINPDGKLIVKSSLHGQDNDPAK